MAYEYKDLLQEGVEDRVRRYVETMDDFDSEELTSMGKDILIRNLTDGAMGQLNGLLTELISAEAYRLTRAVKWAHQHPNADKYGRP